MIKNIIYDLGNVLVRFQPISFLNKCIEEKDREEVLRIIFKSQEWLDLDRGTLTYPEAVELFSEKLPKYEKAIKEFFYNNIEQCLEPIKENVKILEKQSEEGYNLYILSNFHKGAFENLYEKWDFFKRFHGRVISYECNLLKPEREIYLHILEKYKLNPEETLFIDDHEPNVIEANKLGIKVIHLDCYTKLSEKLLEIL